MASITESADDKDSICELRPPVSDDDCDGHPLLAIEVTRTRPHPDHVPTLTSHCCIHKVPWHLRKLSPASYTPRLLSIGPFHYGKEEYKFMENHKARFVEKFIFRTRMTFEGVIQVVKSWEVKARLCYSEPVELDNDTFARLLLLDGAFIIEFMVRILCGSEGDVSDFYFMKPWLVSDINVDLKLMENQLPLFILEGLYKLAISGSSAGLPDLHVLLCDFFSCCSMQRETSQLNEIRHMLDLIRSTSLPFKERDFSTRETGYCFSKCASKLQDAGVIFQVSEKTEHLLKISFSNGVLKIPALKIDANTESCLRNLMAFELCYYSMDTRFIDYIIFLSKLLDKSVKNVDILEKAGIIENWLLEDDSMPNLIHNLLKGITFSTRSFYFASLCQELNAFCDRPVHKWRATYNRTTWEVAATIILVLTLIQAVCSIISVLK